jgi:hypothetical protein
MGDAENRFVGAHGLCGQADPVQYDMRGVNEQGLVLAARRLAFGAVGYDSSVASVTSTWPSAVAEALDRIAERETTPSRGDAAQLPSRRKGGPAPAPEPSSFDLVDQLESSARSLSPAVHMSVQARPACGGQEPRKKTWIGGNDLPATRRGLATHDATWTVPLTALVPVSCSSMVAVNGPLPLPLSTATIVEPFSWDTCP